MLREQTDEDCIDFIRSKSFESKENNRWTYKPLNCENPREFKIKRHDNSALGGR